MLEDDDGLTERDIDQLFAAAPLQDLRPETAERIEAACLSQLRRRREPPIHWRMFLLGALEAILASLLGGSYLLWNLGRALAIYGVHLP